jgi:hypothetical protein
MRHAVWLGALAAFAMLLAACEPAGLPGAGPSALAPTPQRPLATPLVPTPTSASFLPIAPNSPAQTPGPTAGSPAATPAPTAGPSGDAPVVTRADSGRTLQLAVGQRFTLQLGAGYEWVVQVVDPAIVAADPNAPTTTDTQGVYRAVAPGRTELRATGDALCRKENPPCMMPSIEVRLMIEVR